MAESARRRLAFVQGDRHVVVPDRDPALELEFFLEAERSLEPFRASFWIAHSQSEMTHHARSEWNSLRHVSTESPGTRLSVLSQEFRQSPDAEPGEERDDEKTGRDKREQVFLRDPVSTHRQQETNDEQDVDILPDCPAPFPISSVDIVIVAALTQRAEAKRSERGEDEGKIAQIRNEG